MTDNNAQSMKTRESCRGCTYLLQRYTGYSNYTVLGSDMHCLMDANPNLPEAVPDEFDKDENGASAAPTLRHHPAFDRWQPTCNARCEHYTQLLPGGAPNTRATVWEMDCDGDEMPTREGAAQAITHDADPMPMLILTYFEKKGEI